MTTAIAPRHTMVQGRVGRFPWLRRIPVLNFLAGQVALLVLLNRIIRRERVSVIRASDPLYLGLLGLGLARLNRVPLVVRLIANYDGDFYAAGRPAYPRLLRRRSIEKRIDRFVLARADLVAAGNQDILRYALANGAVEDRSTVFLVGSLIEPVHFDVEPQDRSSVREELGLGQRPFLLLVSRLEPPKHPEDTVKILHRAKKEFPDLACVLVGEGTMRPEIERSVAELGLKDSFVFAGNRDQRWIANALSSATVILSPLTGRALVEGALSGAPVVAYDVDWHSELIHDGETGLLVPYRDTEAMADAACRLLRDMDFARAIGRRARDEAIRTMSPEVLVEHERQAYRQLLSRYRRS